MLTFETNLEATVLHGELLGTTNVIDRLIIVKSCTSAAITVAIFFLKKYKETILIIKEYFTLFTISYFIYFVERNTILGNSLFV